MCLSPTTAATTVTTTITATSFLHNHIGVDSQVVCYEFCSTKSPELSIISEVNGMNAETLLGWVECTAVAENKVEWSHCFSVFDSWDSIVQSLNCVWPVPFFPLMSIALVYQS